MLLRELDDIREHSAKNYKVTPYKSQPISKFLLVLGIYLGNVPHVQLDVLRQTPGWRWLSYLKPTAMQDPKWFYLFWAASLVIFSIPRLPSLTRLMEKKTPQKLGSISFSLYLVQGPILLTLGPMLDYVLEWDENYVMKQNGITGFGPLGLKIGFLLAQAVLLPISLSCAYLFEQLVEQPLNRLLQCCSRIIIND